MAKQCQRPRCSREATYVAKGARGGKFYLCTKHFKSLGKTIGGIKQR